MGLQHVQDGGFGHGELAGGSAETQDGDAGRLRIMGGGSGIRKSNISALAKMRFKDIETSCVFPRSVLSLSTDRDVGTTERDFTEGVDSPTIYYYD